MYNKFFFLSWLPQWQGKEAMRGDGGRMGGEEGAGGQEAGGWLARITRQHYLQTTTPDTILHPTLNKLRDSWGKERHWRVRKEVRIQNNKTKQQHKITPAPDTTLQPINKGRRDARERKQRSQAKRQHTNKTTSTATPQHFIKQHQHQTHLGDARNTLPPLCRVHYPRHDINLI